MKKLFFNSALLGTVIFFLDRISKTWALSYSGDLVLNRGISWGLFHSDSSAVFLSVSLAVFLVTLVVLWHGWHRALEGKMFYGELLVCVGSFSNLYDRVMYGGVIDFIMLQAGPLLFPSFNIADAVIVCGTLLLVYDLVVYE